jgi:hypothetical protein
LFLLPLSQAAKPCFNFETAWQHSFLPFSKSIGPCDTHFSRFQNRLGLATLILADFKIVWPLRHSFWPFSKLFGPCDTFLAISKIDWALQHSFWPFSKSFGRCDTHFSRFQNRLGLATLILAVFKIDWAL